MIFKDAMTTAYKLILKISAKLPHLHGFGSRSVGSYTIQHGYSDFVNL
jgi:hypothetical protein